MGFLDKLKNAGKSVLESSGVTITKKGQTIIGGGITNPVIKVDETTISLEREKKARIAKILAPTCEKGDCLWNEGRFYFTCPTDCECERKKVTKKEWVGKVADERFWKYMKRLEKLEDGDFEGKEEIYEDFMAEFLPQYGTGMWGLAEAIIDFGFEREINPFIDIMFELNKMPEIDDIISKLNYLHRECSDETLTYKAFKSESLYDRNTEDFEYTVNIFNIVLNQERLGGFLIDTSVASAEQLFDENGKVKPAGCGGPQAGFYGDTIYNTVETWSGENGENEVND